MIDLDHSPPRHRVVPDARSGRSVENARPCVGATQWPQWSRPDAVGEDAQFEAGRLALRRNLSLPPSHDQHYVRPPLLTGRGAAVAVSGACVPRVLGRLDHVGSPATISRVLVNHSHDVSATATSTPSRNRLTRRGRVRRPRRGQSCGPSCSSNTSTTSRGRRSGAQTTSRIIAPAASDASSSCTSFAAARGRSCSQATHELPR